MADENHWHLLLHVCMGESSERSAENNISFVLNFSDIFSVHLNLVNLAGTKKIKFSKSNFLKDRSV